VNNETAGESGKWKVENKSLESIAFKGGKTDLTQSHGITEKG
jgi:hypothetical protein